MAKQPKVLGFQAQALLTPDLAARATNIPDGISVELGQHVAVDFLGLIGACLHTPTMYDIYRLVEASSYLGVVWHRYS